MSTCQNIIIQFYTIITDIKHIVIPSVSVTVLGRIVVKELQTRNKSASLAICRLYSNKFNNTNQSLLNSCLETI